MLFFILVMFLSMFVFMNSLYYTMILLLIISFLLFSLVVNSMLNTLTMLMLLIVYVGAMMVLIGYICAICPNLILSSNTLGLKYSLLFLFFLFLFLSNIFYPVLNKSSLVMNYFFDVSGVFMFLCIIFMLFITLLMVTSQYLTPKGPFRSLKV